MWATVGTGTNQDGRTVIPMTAPSGEQQKKLLQSICNKFQVDINQLDYIEAHGKIESRTQYDMISAPKIKTSLIVVFVRPSRLCNDICQALSNQWNDVKGKYVL